MKASLSNAARMLGGHIVNARLGQIACPGPGHRPQDRSLIVWMSTTSLADFTVHSHASDNPIECRDHVRARLGLAQWQPQGQDEREGVFSTTPTSSRSRTGDVGDVETSSTGADDAVKIARAIAIWREAADPAGSVVERYLASRGLDLPWQAANEAIRYHPACPWFDAAAGRTIRVPAMVAAFRSIATEEITGIHRTRLSPDGSKVDRRMLGRVSGSAIMLCPMSAVGAGLAVAEGIETALAGWQLGWSNVWALGSVGAIATLPVLPYVQSLTIMAETGDGGASERAIASVGARWIAAGREVLVVEPQCHGDLNDALRGAA